MQLGEQITAYVTRKCADESTVLRSADTFSIIGLPQLVLRACTVVTYFEKQ